MQARLYKSSSFSDFESNDTNTTTLVTKIATTMIIVSIIVNINRTTDICFRFLSARFITDVAAICHPKSAAMKNAPADIR
mmetsp:Transcript_33669/g.77687  ORF Transcript_33669/g.77687 Transcript_33669/m.77687 type:complete len:80 (+) Transcript_33669:528-767(+)